MTPVSALPLAARGLDLPLDDLAFVVVVLIAWVLSALRKRRGAPTQERPRSPAPAPPPSPAPDPWRRSEPAPPASRPSVPPHPSSIHQPEGPQHVLVELEGLARPAAPTGPKPPGTAAPPAPARPLRGRALLLGAPTNLRDRLRAAILWKELLDRPRRLRVRAPSPRPPA